MMFFFAIGITLISVMVGGMFVMLYVMVSGKGSVVVSERPVDTPAPEPEAGITPQLIAVLTAAASTTLGAPVRLRTASIVHTAAQTEQRATTGRNTGHSNHNPRNPRR